VVNVDDYANDPRVNMNDPRRVGPPGVITPQDLLIAFSDGTDADHNGFVDDIAGWDFVDNDNDPFDDVQYGHGTGEARDSTAEAAQHHNQPGVLPHVILVNSVTRYDDTFTPQPRSYLQFNGCTNFMSKIAVAVPSSSCSSEATGRSSGIVGLIYSEARNRGI